jgi:transposase
MNSKKKIVDETRANPSAHLLFFDESRFGTHSRLGHGWFERGTRPKVKVSMGFKNFYVYSAVNSENGYCFSLVLPYVNTYCMNVFLEKLADDSNGQNYILVLDGASWHKSSDLRIPDNIKIIFLPPYSPELNPVERLWNYLKSNTIKNRIYSSLHTLESTVCRFLRNLDPKIIMSVCSCDYMSNLI